MCENADTIGKTGISYCPIPICDKGENCRGCSVYQKDAIIALAEEIMNLHKKVKRLEGVVNARS